MEASWTTLLRVALTGTVATGFYSGTEIGLLSLDTLRIRSHAGGFGHRMLSNLLARRRGLIITTIIGSNLSLVGTSVILTGLAVKRWEEAASLPVTLVLTLFVFIFGEVLPKAFFRRYAHSLMVLSAFPLLANHLLFRPITAVAMFAMAALRAPFEKGASIGRLISREQLRHLFAESTDEETGGIDTPMIARVLRLRTTTARQVMIPLDEVVMIPEGAPTRDVLEAVRRGGPTRIPVYGASRNRIVGIINVFDILFDPNPDPRSGRYLRNVEVVACSRRTDELLVALRRTKSGMAVVMEATGQSVGIVTIEDLVEEIVGELADEHEPPAAEPAAPIRAASGTPGTPPG